MTAALENGEWSAARTDRTLPPGKSRYTLPRGLGRAQSRSGRAENSRPHRDSIPDCSQDAVAMYKLKDIFTVEQARKAQRWNSDTALLFHNRGTGKWWVVSSTTRPHFTTGKEPAPILQETGWGPRAGKEARKISSPTGFDARLRS